ncbi:Asp23/Gls24 family envelope stress response protein [Actinomadura rubrisoli]|uniref:Asp23/Gls24 family envelope stress response protein n=1 Tax=Actinomadura rubrisoli TaxID=2530368 RepID=A0A4R5B4J3_9ACTN|nr:Asp23/Gls24 family envelope stress response protein [Actinomadura rubrisoli]TDD79709.1 Asp23/Gls24 family envelope stress response protein [Actinomadura rubrisoli]
MAELEKGGTGSGGEPRPEVRSMPFFPGNPGQPGPGGPVPRPGTPLSAPTVSPAHSVPSASPAPSAPPAAAPAPPAPSAPGAPGPSAPGTHAPVTPGAPLHGGRSSGEGTAREPDAPPGGGPGPGVEGRITIEDEVIEKIAVMAALEVSGVVALAGPAAGREPGDGAGQGGGRRQGAEAVRVRLHDDEVTLDLGIAVGYGSVIMDVATAVKANVGRVAGLMLGMRIAAVNVSVEDVRMPPARG